MSNTSYFRSPVTISWRDVDVSDRELAVTVLDRIDSEFQNPSNIFRALMLSSAVTADEVEGLLDSVGQALYPCLDDLTPDEAKRYLNITHVSVPTHGAWLWRNVESLVRHESPGKFSPSKALQNRSYFIKNRGTQ